MKIQYGYPSHAANPPAHASTGYYTLQAPKINMEVTEMNRLTKSSLS